MVGLEKEGTKEGGTAVFRREALICHTAQFALPFPYFQQNFDSSSRNSGRRPLLCMWVLPFLPLFFETKRKERTRPLLCNSSFERRQYSFRVFSRQCGRHFRFLLQSLPPPMDHVLHRLKSGRYLKREREMTISLVAQRVE